MKKQGPVLNEIPSAKKGKKVSRPFYLVLLILLLVLAALIILAVSIGPSSLTMKDSFLILSERIPGLNQIIKSPGYAGNYHNIVFKLRLPRILLSVLAGASLALVGAVFQSMFRNPLADPHILGISSGAAFGATVALVLGLEGSSVLGLGGMGLFAFIFALATVWLVYFAAGAQGTDRAMMTMLLIGVALGSLFSSIISLMMLFNHEKIAMVYLWTLGSFNASSWTKVYFMSAVFFPCTAYLLTQGRSLNLLMAGDEEALSMGLDTAKQRIRLVWVSSLLVAATVSVSGIIGFVGLVIPHYLRVLGQSDLRRQLPLSLMVGGIFVLFCDTLARTILAPVEVPVGIITSLFGVPYFIYVIVQKRRKGEF